MVVVIMSCWWWLCLGVGVWLSHRGCGCGAHYWLSVVNNKVRGGNGDLLRIETKNDNYVVIRRLPHRCQ